MRSSSGAGECGAEPSAPGIAPRVSSLDDVLALVERRVREERRPPLVLFDLDGTVFDNRPRTAEILREVAASQAERAPVLAAALRSSGASIAYSYTLRRTLIALGIHDDEELGFVQREWERRFFSDDYLAHDVPVAGAPVFVRRVHEAGALVVYLTGRDAPRMLVGTAQSLRAAGCPVGIERAVLLLKPDPAVGDVDFKRGVAPYLRSLGSVAAFFENEPSHANILGAAFPQAVAVFLDTQHSEDAPPLAIPHLVVEHYGHE